MRLHLKRVFLFLILCGLWSQLSAQQYGYVQYHSGSDAPFTRVNTVIQDKEGFVWIGSKNGLYRFDGISFDFFSIHTESQSIHQIHSNQNGLVFVNDMGLYQIDNLENKPKVVTLLEGTINQTDSTTFYPNDFIIASDKSIWVSQSNHSIGRWQNGKYKTYYFSKTKNAQKISIQQDSKGAIWVLSPIDGLFRFDTSNEAFDKFLDIKNGSELLIHNKHFLIGNENLNVYALKNNKLKLIKIFTLENDQVTAINPDQNNHYYVGTKKGNLFKIERFDKSPQTIYGANEAHRVEKLDFGNINEIYNTTDSTTHKKQLWVSSETGLWLLEQRFFKTVENLPMNNPIGISISDEGKAWVPINYIFEISKSQNGFGAEIIYNTIQANAVAHDKSGALWISTTTPRVELLKMVNDRIVKRYDFHDRGESVFYLYPDSKGNLWFNQAPINKPIIGTGKIDRNGTVTIYDETKGFSSRVLALKESSRGEIYAVGIGEKSYLYRLDPEQNNFVNLSPELPFKAMLNFEAHDLTIDDRGIVWLATTDGLLRYDGEKINLIENDILGQEEIRGVTHYSNNNIWLATATKGLVFHQQNTSTILGETEGLPAPISAYRCISTDKEGRLWAGTAEGLVYSRISASTLPNSHKPRIKKILLNSTELNLNLNKIFEVKKGQQLEFHFTNLSFPAKNVQYQYRLLSKTDKDILLEEQLWLPIGHNNTLHLSDVETGYYSLEVRARQPGGYQWSQPMELELNIFMPWYLKTWVIYALVIFLILFIGFYFRVYVKRRFMRLQEVLKYSNEKLAKKEEQLNLKIKELEEKGDQLFNAKRNIQTLELFIKEIPKKASWDDIITAMGKAVTQTSEVNAFEIAFKENNEIVHKGYSDQERSGFTFRTKPFNSKSSLTCWAMENNKEVLINDFIKEHTMYINEKDAYRFRSLLFIPFALENNQLVVLCAYSTFKNHFDHDDQVMFRILAQFIYFSIHEELTKRI